MSFLATVAASGDKKTGPIAVTYRAGSGSMYSTCPGSCPMMVASETGTTRVDREYLDALIHAVPRGGIGFTYTHFPVRTWIQRWRAARKAGKRVTTINASADNELQAAEYVKRQIPVVVAMPARPESEKPKAWKVSGQTIIRCPAEYQPGRNCGNCGGSDGPLCARADRKFAIAFFAHGSGAKRVGDGERGGCYAHGGNVGFHWRRYAQKSAEDCARKLREFVASLPFGTTIRHHVSGDIGAQT